MECAFGAELEITFSELDGFPKNPKISRANLALGGKNGQSARVEADRLRAPPMHATAQTSRRELAGGSRAAYSLVELIVVVAIVSLLLAFAAPGFVALGPSRKAGLHEVANFLEQARAQAVATRSPRIVAFADEAFPRRGDALRAYALFAFAETEDGSGEEGLPRRLTPWRTLPKGLVFAKGEHFEVEGGIAFRTLHDFADRRTFPAPGPDGRDTTAAALPCLVFGPGGGVLSPAFIDADALHVGLVEGFYDPGPGRLALTSTRSASGDRALPNGDCLGIGLHTGRIRLLTD